MKAIILLILDLMQEVIIPSTAISFGQEELPAILAGAIKNLFITSAA